MSFFNAVKAAAAAAVEKTKEGVAHLRALPTELTCSSCKRPVMIPATTFNWACTNCTLSNVHSNETCSACNAPRPEEKDVTIECTMCHTVNPVPRSNATKMLKSAAENTKAAAISAKEAAERKYNHLKSRPEQFHCQHCNSVLMTPEPIPSDQGVVEVKAVVCPVCKMQTNVPGTNFEDSMKHAAVKLQQGAVKTYYDLAGRRYARCPVCATPIEAKQPGQAAPQPVVAPPAEGPAPGQPAPEAAAPGAAVAAAAAPAPGAPSQAQAPTQRVDLHCEKCNTQFPAVV